jgi:beta-galactosidase
VTGAGWLAGTDNGRQENAAGYQAPDVAAFRGRAVGLVRAGRQPGRIQVTVTSPGLPAATIELRAAATPLAASIGGTGTVAAPAAAQTTAAAAAAPAADASYSGAPGTIPAMMLDGNTSTAWSNYYVKAQTANIRAVSSSNASDWVSLSWPSPRRLGSLTATFTTGGPLALPASAQVSYWNGRALVPVPNLTITWATASGQPSTFSFDPVTTTQIRLTMTSPSPGTASGFLSIADLKAS